MIPFKYHRGHTQEYKNRHKAANDLAATAVSKIRQPIESLFAWIIEKTGIQIASKKNEIDRRFYDNMIHFEVSTFALEGLK